jgi:hypothetical protein
MPMSHNPTICGIVSLSNTAAWLIFVTDVLDVNDWMYLGIRFCIPICYLVSELIFKCCVSCSIKHKRMLQNDLKSKKMMKYRRENEENKCTMRCM